MVKEDGPAPPPCVGPPRAVSQAPVPFSPSLLWLFEVQPSQEQEAEPLISYTPLD